MSLIGKTNGDGILKGIKKKKKGLNQLENVTRVHIMIIQHFSLYFACMVDVDTLGLPAVPVSLLIIFKSTMSF